MITMDTACSQGPISGSCSTGPAHTLSSPDHMAVGEGFHFGQTEIEEPVRHLGVSPGHLEVSKKPCLQGKGNQCGLAGTGNKFYGGDLI